MFLSKLKECINIYDIMLLCFEQIKNQSLIQLVGKYEPKEYNDCAGFISEYVEESETSTLAAMSNLVQNITVAYQRHNFGPYEFFTIIKTIDNICEYNMFEISLGEYVRYEGINTLGGIGANVVPIIKNTIINKYDEYLTEYEKSHVSHGGLRKKYKQNTGDINDYLYNYIIVRDYPYKVNIYSINEGFNFFNNATNNRFDSICVPVTNSALNEIYRINENEIGIKEINEEYKYKITEIYEKSILKDDGCDLLIFPELFFTGIDLKNICNIVSKTTYKNDKIIILGSYCKNESNKCVVITSYGTLLFEQHKKTHYEQNGKYENLTKSNDIINLIDVPNVGRICVVICKDIVNDDIKRLIKVLSVDIVVIVSYSPSLDLKSSSEDLAKTCHCISIMCNSCSAMKNKQEKQGRIGYVSVPAKQETYSDYHTEFYTNEQCLKCSMCAGHRISIKYDEINRYDDNKIGPKINKTLEI